MESMARDMRHPYIPSTTVLGDMYLLKMLSIIEGYYIMFHCIMTISLTEV